MISVSAAGLALFGVSLAWGAFTGVVPGAVLIGLDKVIQVLGDRRDERSAARG